jgi:hypothetical protein
VVFGVERPAEGRTIMPDVMPRYAGALDHRDDCRIVADADEAV